jgi:hypothetical protein
VPGRSGRFPEVGPDIHLIGLPRVLELSRESRAGGAMESTRIGHAVVDYSVCRPPEAGVAAQTAVDCAQLATLNWICRRTGEPSPTLDRADTVNT